MVFSASKLLWVFSLLFSLSATSPNDIRKLQSFVSDNNTDVDKFLQSSYSKVGYFMAESFFIGVPTYNAYFSLLADIGARYLSLPPHIRYNVQKKFIETAPVRKTIDIFTGYINNTQKDILLEMLTKFNILTDTDSAISFVFNRDRQLAERLHIIHSDVKKQYDISTKNAQIFITKTMDRFYNKPQQELMNITLHRSYKEFLKLHETDKISVTKILLSSVNNLLHNIYNELIIYLQNLLNDA